MSTNVAGHPIHLALCGFGLAAAGAGAAYAIAALPRSRGPRRAYLLGIAGTYHPRRLPVGGVIAGTFARCLGIGAGAGRRHISAEAMGWSQGISRPGLPPVMDTVPLCVPLGVHSSQFTVHSSLRAALVFGGLLSVTAASGSRHEAAQRARAHPDALAEDMEAFAVALAARLAGLPLTVIRGVSNVAGDRDTARWRTAEALAAGRTVLEHLLER